MNKIVQVSSGSVGNEDDFKCKMLYSTKIVSDVTFSVSSIVRIQYYYFKRISFKFGKEFEFNMKM